MRRTAAAAVWLPAVGLGVAVVVSAAAAAHPFGDLTVYRAGAGAVGDAGRHLYSVRGSNGGGFTYPPFAALVLWPLRLPGVVAAGAVLAAVSLAAAAGVARWSTRSWPMWIAAAITAAALATVPFRNALWFGQIGVLLMWLVLADLVAEHPRWPRGALIGVATAVKLTPGLFIVLLLVAGRRRAAAVAAASFAAATALAAVVIPVASWHYWTGELWHTDRVGAVSGGRNRSLPGVLLHAGVPAAVVVVVCIAIAVVGLTRGAVALREARPVAAAAIVGLTTCVVSPVTWTHHLVWVLPAMAVLATVDIPIVARIVAVAVVTVTFARWSPHPHVLAVVECATAVLLVVVLPVRRISRREAPGTPSDTRVPAGTSPTLPG